MLLCLFITLQRCFPISLILACRYGTDNEQEVQRQRQQQQCAATAPTRIHPRDHCCSRYDPYDPWGVRQRHAIRSRTLKVSTELLEDILQGNSGTWLLLLLSEYNCQQVFTRAQLQHSQAPHRSTVRGYSPCLGQSQQAVPRHTAHWCAQTRCPRPHSNAAVTRFIGRVTIDGRNIRAQVTCPTP